jgi:uncharacterized membrane protein
MANVKEQNVENLNAKEAFFVKYQKPILIAVAAIILIIAGLIAGLVFYCIKYYAYSLVPYITAENADLDALNIARESDAKTKGYKGKMFGTDILIVLMIAGVGIVFGIFGKIPAIGGFFAFLGNLVARRSQIFQAHLCP